MPENRLPDYSSVCSLLDKGIIDALTRINTTKENLELKEKHEQSLKVNKAFMESIDASIAVQQKLVDDLTEYVTLRREKSQQAVSLALQNAKDIVPASCSHIRWRMEGGEAWFETSDAIPIEHCEGAGFRSVLSVYMRALFLRANPNYLQMLVLDELFSKLDVESSAILSTYLEVLADSLQVIIIEQKPEVVANAHPMKYYFVLKDTDDTEVILQDD